MKSLQQYSKDKNHFIHSLQSALEHPICENEYDLMTVHGKNIDNIFHKISIYNHRHIKGGFIHESYMNVGFNIDEQFAARDLLICTANKYIESLYEEYCNEYNLPIDEGLFDNLKGGVKKASSKVQDFVKNVENKAKEGWDKLVENVKQVKDFIEAVKKGVIDSAKKLVEKVNEMMISLGTSLAKLVQTLGGDEKESYQFFESKVEEALKDEKSQKENVYESFGKALSNNEQLVLEWNPFKKKDKKQDSSNDKQDKDNKKSSNEYDDAAKAKPGKFKAGAKMVGKALLQCILQMLAYYAVTILLPAIVTLTAGPLAGAIVGVIAKIAWSSTTLYKQVKSMMQTVKSADYKKSPKWMKAVRWALFVLSVAGAAFTIVTGLSDAWKIGEAIAKGAAGTVLPDEAVVKLTKTLNGFWKDITGSDTPGYEALVKAENATWTEIVEQTSDAAKAAKEGENKFDTHKSNEFKVSETNNFDHTKDIAGDDLANKMKELANSDNIKGSMKMLDQVKDIQVDTPGVTAFAVDGSVMGGQRAAWIAKIANDLGVDPSNIDINQVTNTALANSTNNAAGTIFQVVVKGAATPERIETITNAVAGHGGFCHILSNIANHAETVSKVIEHPMELIKGTFCAFGGLFPTAKKFLKRGGFNLRLSSKASGGKLYKVESENDIKEMQYSEFKSKYSNLNPNVFTNMEKIVNTNMEALNKYKEEKEKESKLSSQDKKRLKAINAQIEKMKDGSKDYTVLVFYGNKVENVKTKKQTNEAKETKEEATPLMFFNPMLMGFGDLAAGSSKGVRKKLYYVKGLFASIEILPVDGGMSVEEVVEMFINLSNEAINSAYNMNPDVPCYKEGKQWIENDKSIYKGKARQDFGMFTNTEITEIMNNKDEMSKYLGGEHYTGSNKTNEKQSTEKQKEHHTKVVKRYKENIENDKELKEFIDKSKTLKGKGKLVDDDGHVNDEELEKLCNKLIRIEHNYLSKKKKKGFFQSIKDFFFGSKDDEKEQYDPEEVKQLALKIASIEKKKREKKNESIEDYEPINLIYEANLQIMERELGYFLQYGELIDESIIEDDYEIETYNIDLD